MITQPKFFAFQMPDLFLNDVNQICAERLTSKYKRKNWQWKNFAGLAEMKHRTAFHSSGASDRDNLSHCNSPWLAKKGDYELKSMSQEMSPVL